MALLEARALNKSFTIEGGLFQRAKGWVRAVSNISFKLDPGETLSLVGESGSGKTTLGKLLVGLLKPDGGEIFWEGQPIHFFSRQERARKIQIIFQDPTSSLNPKLSVSTLLGEALRVRETSLDTRMGITNLLQIVGLPVDCLNNYPHQFSGGQRQRLAIARALAIQPQILIADEPVSALDLSIQAQILNLLTDLKTRFGMAYIVISHDLAVVSHMADRILVMKDGEVVESGDTQSVLENPQHAYTKRLLESVPTL